MIRWFVHRLIVAVAVLFFALTGAYFLLLPHPEDTVDALCGLACPQEIRESIIEKYGLQESSLDNYFIWMGRVICCLDFGYSVMRKTANLKVLLLDGYPYWVIALTVVSVFTSLILGSYWGIRGAVAKYTMTGRLSRILAIAGDIVPYFLLGWSFIIFVIGVLKPGSIHPIFQYGGLVNPEFRSQPISLEMLLNLLWHLLPLILLIGLFSGAAVARAWRTSLTSMLQSDELYREPFPGESDVILNMREAFNLMIHNLFVNRMFWTHSLVEAVLFFMILFGIPQIGGAIPFSGNDQGVLAVFVIFFVVLQLVANLIMDLLYVLTQPKIRYR